MRLRGRTQLHHPPPSTATTIHSMANILNSIKKGVGAVVGVVVGAGLFEVASRGESSGSKPAAAENAATSTTTKSSSRGYILHPVAGGDVSTITPGKMLHSMPSRTHH